MAAAFQRWISRFGYAVTAVAAANTLILQATSKAGTVNIPAPAGGPGIRNAIPIRQLQPGMLRNVGGYTINPATIRLLSQAQAEQASRIRTLGKLASVVQETATIAEAGDGVLIQTQLSYAVQFGACLKNKQILAAAGIRCRNTRDLNASSRELSDPNSERYISNQAKREEAIQKLERAKATFTDLGAKLRLNLNKPQAITKLGQATVSELSQLSDAQLGNEILNAGTVDIQQAIYIPSANTLLQSLRKVKSLEGNSIDNLMRLKLPTSPGPQSRSHSETDTAAPGPEPYPIQTINSDATTAGLFRADSSTQPGILLASLPSQGSLIASNNSNQSRDDVFLAGFTFGKQYEWKKRVGTTIDICWPFDCNRSLYVEPYAKFSYGLGLRFPIRAKTNYSTSGDNGRVTVNLDPFDGSAQDYTRAGITGEKTFEGKELVAEIGGEAGVRYNIYVDSGNPHFAMGYDLTEKLPPGFRNGNFVPPSPQRPLPAIAPIFIESIDLLGGSFNYGVVWAKVHPGLKADITSRELSLKIIDNYGSGTPQRISDGQSKQVAIRNGKSSITLKDPKYNIAFSITPGVRAKIGVDVVVWEDDWHYDIWIPELSISLPPSGVDFSCHAGTVCTRNYEFLASGSAAGGGSGSGGDSGGSGNPGGSTGGRVACSAGNKLGRFALRSELSGRYIRGGVTAEGTDTAVGAQATAIGGNSSWESFDVYELGNQDGRNSNTLAFRSSLAPSRWISVAENNSLQLAPGFCNSSTNSKLFAANRTGNTLQLQSLRNGQWVIQRSNGNLYANAPNTGGNVPQALRFTLVPLAGNNPGVGGNEPRPTPSPAPSTERLDGWWQGDRGGFYSIQTSGSSFEMKGFNNNGSPVNLFSGTISGNRISGSWRSFCDNRTGSAVLEVSNGQLQRVGGTTANSRWSRSSRPANLQTIPNCQQTGSGQPAPASINLSGSWRGNDGGTYVIRQTGNNLSWQGAGGNFRNTFNGQIRGNMITGYWQDTADSQTQNAGRLTLRIDNNNQLTRYSHTGAFTGSLWQRSGN